LTCFSYYIILYIQSFMSVKLVILGFLKRKALYGYEIKQMVEREMGDWTNIAFGSIYFALSKLTKEGFITQKETQKRDYRPSRIIYQITEKGEE
jgi:DNA-binding PadR family transcriptional regulator